MNKEPCVRFGMRISPKISENPADSRNNRPPKAMLLPASRREMFIGRMNSQRAARQPGSAGSKHSGAARRAEPGTHIPEAAVHGFRAAELRAVPGMTLCRRRSHQISLLRALPAAALAKRDSALHRRLLARVDRLRQQPCLRPAPEPTDTGLRLH